jgi:hypothetical protein
MAQVLVGNGDQVEIRYPTPSTWNTRVTVQVQIGTGIDPDDVTFGTRVPNAQPDQFIFSDQNGFTEPERINFKNIFEKNTFYYSNEIEIKGIEIFVPAVINVTTDGPKTLTDNVSECAFQINGNGSWVTSAQVRDGDKIQLRIKTEDWYTMTTNVELAVSDETWGTDVGQDPVTVIDTWTLTTRAQDQTIPQYTFIDYVDVRDDGSFGTYKTKIIDIEGIDDDTVLRASATTDGQVSADNVNWSQLVTGLVLGDKLYTRIAIGDTYTTKTTSNFDVFAVAGDTVTKGGQTYENNVAGTFGPPEAEVTQTLGTVKDSWQIWTEVDRYPDEFSLSPIYTKSDGDDVVVSSEHTYSAAEVGFTYYCDFDISGLGVEYPAGAYSDLDDPFVSETSTGIFLPIDTSSVNGRDVEVRCRISLGSARIRKNNVGEWVQSLYVKNGDQVNVRFIADEDYNTSINSKIVIDGPPDGGTVLNPTNGPTIPTFDDKEDTITLKTRQARVSPYPFKAANVYEAEPGEIITRVVPFEGTDENIRASILSQSLGTNARISYDGINFSSFELLGIPPTATSFYIRVTAPTDYGEEGFVNYKVGEYTDTIKIYTKQEGWTYSVRDGGGGINQPIEYFVPEYAEELEFVLVGAGGGNGGDDAPNSFGGIGGLGNVVRGYITLPPSFFELDNRILLWPASAGENGVDFTLNAAGGAGGWGYATGGDGGESGPGDKSGSGGGGGGASAITFLDGTPIVIAGGGGGGAGAGNDTVIQKDNQNGNYNGFGTLKGDTTGLPLDGQDGPDNPSQGGGAGGAGGGFGSAGVIVDENEDEFGVVVQTDDLDATGGSGGGAYYDPSLVVLADTDDFNNAGGGPGRDGQVVVGYAPQDRTPNPFSFDVVEGADPLVQIESEKVSIFGITGRVDVAVFEQNSQVRVCDPNGNNCGSWGSTAFVRNEEQIQLRATPGARYFTPYPVRVEVGTEEVYWSIFTGAAPDRNPLPFDIPDKVDQEISVPGAPNLVESDQVTISGINVSVGITASNGAEISVCDVTGSCGPFAPAPTANPQSISNDQSFKVRIAASESYNSTVSTTVRVGESDGVDFLVTTIEEPDDDPNPFLFFNATNQPPNTEVLSKNSVTIQGIDTTIIFEVTGGATIIKNGIDTGLSSVPVSLYDIIRLKYTTGDEPGVQADFDITAGQYETEWSVTTAGSFGTNPDPFIIGDKFAEPLQYAESDEITISGLGVSSVGIFGTNNAEFSIGGSGFNVYTVTSPAAISNGQTFKVRLLANAIRGFSSVTRVFVGSYNTTFTVFTNVGVGDIIKGQWYSSIQPIKKNQSGGQVRFSTKFEGLPIGSMMPVFQDSTENDKWGNLDGKADSRFHGWIWCNGDYVNRNDFPLLYEVIEKRYGATALDEDLFRLPDFRNRKVLGTGSIDGQASSSPVVSPIYGPGKSAGETKGADVPGSSGGMWFIDTIGDPGAELEQVQAPPDGQPAQISDYFAVANIRTTGYENDTRLFEVPLHTHQLITGQRDAFGNKGYVTWGGDGGYNAKANIGPNLLGEPGPSIQEGSVQINLWGYAFDDYEIGSSDTVEIQYDAKDRNNVWTEELTEFTAGGSSGFIGEFIGDSYNTIEIKQPMLQVSANLTDVSNYIDVNMPPFGASPRSGDEVKFLGSIDIPEREVVVDPYRPPNRATHSHYVSLTQPGDPNTTYSYGKDNGPGATLSSFDNETVELEFSALEVGIEVLPGTFTLNANKQLIPVPSFAPQDQVPLITPYTWVKWLIKAF